jgi:hypothetical protein
MTITELIAALEAVRKEHGDLPVVRYQCGTGGTCSESGHDPYVEVEAANYEPCDDGAIFRIDGKLVGIDVLYPVGSKVAAITCWPWDRVPKHEVKEDTK